MRPLFVGGLLLWTAALGLAQKAPEPPASTPRRPAILTDASAAGFERTVKPFLATNCVPCHGNEKHKKDLNFESFTSVDTLIADRERWDAVVEMLRTREMPPEDEPQPAEHQRQAVAGWLQRELARIDRLTPPDPGRVTARRLNRAEYNNTIRDLLGVELRPADDFPQDDSGYGFDNIGDVLSLSPALMEKYLSAADRVARAAVFGTPALPPTLTKLRSEGRRNGEARTFPAQYDRTGLSLPNAFHALHRLPVEADYVVRVGLGGARPLGSDPITLALWIDEKQIASLPYDAERAASFDQDRQDFNANTTQFRVRLPAGEHQIAVAIPHIYEGLPVRYGGPNPATRPEPPERVFTPRPGATPEQIAQQRQRFEESQTAVQKLPFNAVRVNVVEVGGPYRQVTGPSRASREKIYLCGHQNGAHTDACVPRIMTGLARRAFRRPVAEQEIAQYVTLVRQAQKDEGSFDEGLTVGLQALLVSPDFLFRIERSRPAPRAALSQRITQHELATRLSYFLWATMPDEALQRAADAGTLRDPRVLSAQVRRMLRDP